MNKLKPILFIAIFLSLSIYIGSNIKGSIVGISNNFVSAFKNGKEFITNKINNHFYQAQEIQKLRTENQILRKESTLLNTVANELNQILKDTKSIQFSPDVQISRILSYVNISDYSKFWIDFKGIKKDEIRGAIYQGNTAGIITQKDGNAVAILQTDPKSSFSVAIGDSKIPGIANGDGKNVVVKFIPQWLKPEIGEEVYTSGMDNIFFAGVPVGKIKEIVDDDLYKSAIIEPYFKENIPTFLYIVIKER
ncbi:rod shape-determining protein MreC [Campylobacter blaseri]|uniref:Cell shape-determining protein MreC n=1 Tax=Campylobacter blaseri TaxID=2042961 RepID=A0A2P8R141_9BACT|nr:rod shape-determining protein MreC [Campylobacter blaseri]PSM52209.1 rod shape-determining protein MreC [Campylobacter blaseri]PSM53975.1 rod shape-determining protein MreC [Campylobacter blaseri]QKF85413.1 rod shape-determining protein MreC [Campylobacter blaseri]